MEEKDALIAPRQPYSVASVMPHVCYVADSAKKSIYRGYQFITTTPTSRYVAAALSEATHYVLARLSQSISSLQTHDPEWSYTDEVVKGERWLTLDWYERQLVDTKEHEDSGDDSLLGFVVNSQLPRHIQPPADFRGDQYACWVRNQAFGEAYDEEAGYHVAKLAVVTPAQWQLSDHCAACGELFGPSRHRHLGATKHRVCDECDASMDSLATAERAEWRVCRVKMLLHEAHRGRCELPPYFDVPVDTATNKARRLLRAAAAVARTCRLLAPASATIAVEVLEILCRYGPAGLATLVLRREFVEAAELLRRVARVDTAWPLSAHELTAAIYYLLALRRGARGSDPDAEKRQFSSCPSCDDETLNHLRATVPAALWCYLESPTAVELVARQQGYALLFENGWRRQREAVAQPGFICIARLDGASGSGSKKAILAVRGTASVHDVATDVRAFPAPFPPQQEFEGNGTWTSVSGTFAFAGMARAAQWLYDEIAPALLALALGGFEIILTGHSLGAGVASLVAVMLRNGLDERGLQDARVHCFGFATPACVDMSLAEKTVGLITSVVLHDDVVPRLTARSLRALMTELLRQRETCMRHWRDDLDAVWGRLRHGLWAPRWRDSLLRESTTATSLSSDAQHVGINCREPPSSNSSHDKVRLESNVQRTDTELDVKGTTLALSMPLQNRQQSCSEIDILGDASYGSDELEDNDKWAETRLQNSDQDSDEFNGRKEDVQQAHAFISLERDGATEQNGLTCQTFLHTEPFAIESEVPEDREQIRRSEQCLALSAAISAGVDIQSHLSSVEGRSWQLTFSLQVAVDSSSSIEEHFRGESVHNDGGSSSSSDYGSFRECLDANLLHEEIPEYFAECEQEVREHGGQACVTSSEEYTSPTFEEADIDLTDRISCGPLFSPTQGSNDLGVGALSDGESHSYHLCEVADVFDTGTAYNDADKLPKGQGSACETIPHGSKHRLCSDDCNDLSTACDSEIKPNPEIHSETGETAFSSNITEIANNINGSGLHSDDPPASLSTNSGYPHRSRVSPSADEEDEARLFAEDFDDVDKLPELFVPGRVVHIYSWRGTYDAALVDRGCAALADIAVSANMISDHSIQSYFDAIAEVINVRQAQEHPPPWQPFHATDTCQCCGAKFTWHVTSSSEAQTFREKHNCRNCGLLVCDPCSKRRKPLPKIGLLEPSRVCDRCHYKCFSEHS